MVHEEKGVETPTGRRLPEGATLVSERRRSRHNLITKMPESYTEFTHTVNVWTPHHTEWNVGINREPQLPNSVPQDPERQRIGRIVSTLILRVVKTDEEEHKQILVEVTRDMWNTLSLNSRPTARISPWGNILSLNGQSVIRSEIHSTH